MFRLAGVNHHRYGTLAHIDGKDVFYTIKCHRSVGTVEATMEPQDIFEYINCAAYVASIGVVESKVSLHEEEDSSNDN